MNKQRLEAVGMIPLDFSVDFSYPPENAHEVAEDPCSRDGWESEMWTEFCRAA